jgi:hypothetical protein
MKIKPTFFVLMVSGTIFISKKIKEQGFLRKSHQKTCPLDPGSGINSSRIQGVKNHRSLDPGSATLVGCVIGIRIRIQIADLDPGLYHLKIISTVLNAGLYRYWFIHEGNIPLDFNTGAPLKNSTNSNTGYVKSIKKCTRQGSHLNFTPIGTVNLLQLVSFRRNGGLQITTGIKSSGVISVVLRPCTRLR